jgi:LemA protein
MFGLITLLVAFGLLAWAVGVYNRFVRLVAQSEEAWQDIEVQLKRRFDLIPNLVETVKGYASHEKEALERVVSARAEAMKGGSLEEQAASENMLTGALKSLFAISEAYPDLKANTNFLELQRELSDTENKIQASRRFYNGNVRDLDIALKTFPSNLIGNMFHFQGKPYFDIPDDSAAQEPVAVKF